MTTTLDLLRCKRMPEPSLSPGVYFDLDARDYHRAAALSGTVLGEYIDSPLQCRAYLDSEDDEGTPDTDLGNLSHFLGLEPEEFWRYVQFGGPRWPEKNKDGSPCKNAGQPLGKTSKKYIAWADKVRTEGKFAAHEDDRDYLTGIGNTLCTNHDIREQLGRRGEDAASEVSIFWINDLNLPCKCRVDRVRFEGGLNRASDIKTTRATTIRAFMRELWGRHYPVKAIHYLEGLAAAAQFDKRFVGEWEFSWIAIPKGLRTVEAFVCGLNDEGWAVAEAQHRLAVEGDRDAQRIGFAQSFLENDWPGLASGGRVTYGAPEWLEQQMSEFVVHSGEWNGDPDETHGF